MKNTFEKCRFLSANDSMKIEVKLSMVTDLLLYVPSPLMHSYRVRQLNFDCSPSNSYHCCTDNLKAWWVQMPSAWEYQAKKDLLTCWGPYLEGKDMGKRLFIWKFIPDTNTLCRNWHIMIMSIWGRMCLYAIFYFKCQNLYKFYLYMKQKHTEYNNLYVK